MSFRVVTVANRKPAEPYYTFDEFFKSLGEEEPLVLGSQPREYGGLGSKPRLLYSAIKEGIIPETHIIFCDCFDIVFATSIHELFNDYLDYAVPLVFSCERNCYPVDLKEQYDKLTATSSYKYLNSGMIVGETEAMLTVLEAIDAKNIPNDYWSEEKKCMINPNDQEYYQKVFLEQPVEMTLDYEQMLCNTLHSSTLDDFDFSKKRIKNKETGFSPCSFHFNGNSKTENNLRSTILKHLNLL